MKHLLRVVGKDCVWLRAFYGVCVAIISWVTIEGLCLRGVRTAGAQILGEKYVDANSPTGFMPHAVAGEP